MFYGKVKGRGYITQIKSCKKYIGMGQGDNGSSYVTLYDKIGFKRNINDVNGRSCFKTEAELRHHIEMLKSNENINIKSRNALDNYEVVEHDSVPIKKRYLVSKRIHKFIELRTSKTDGDCCGTCGWTISYEEPFLQFKDMQICMHCMKEFYDLSKNHLDNMDRAYHDTWLIERVTKEL